MNVVAGPGSDRAASGSSSIRTSPRSRSPARPRSGASIAAGAAATIKRVTLELGGKSRQHRLRRRRPRGRGGGRAAGGVRQRRPGLLRALADPRRSASALDRFMDALERAVEALRVGDPLDEDTQMGPLISAGQRETVASFLDDDAPVAIRGSAPDGPGLLVRADGARARSNHDRARARGDLRAGRRGDPVRGRGTRRSRSPTTRSTGCRARSGRATARARCASRARVETGVLSINSNSSVRVTTPFGGFKQSGYGRELGPHALDAYTEVKNVYYATE